MTYTSKRGRIDPPQLDDRTWQDLVAEMKRLIPAYAPQWTDHNPSDIGITLMELFAWLGESLIYRLNQVPAKSYIAFLNLLGITRSPAVPAATYLTFSTATDPLLVPAGTQAQTQGAAGQDVVVFETDEDVNVRQTNLKASLILDPYAPGANSHYRNMTADLVGPLSRTTSPPALTVPPATSVQICLGFDRRVTGELVLEVLLSVPALSAATTRVEWVYSKGSVEPRDWPVMPTVQDGTAALTRDGRVRCIPGADWGLQRATAPLPPTTAKGWQSVTATGGTVPVSDELGWLGCRITNSGTASVALGLERVLFNSARARTALTVRTPELLPGTGAPLQIVALAHRPLYRDAGIDTAYAHLVVEVEDDEPPHAFSVWDRVDDLPAGDQRSYRLDPVTGELMFGDFDRNHPDGHGRIPAAGRNIRARYRYVAAGAAGNVDAQRVTSPGTLPTNASLEAKSVTNLGPAEGGVDEEPIEQTLRRAPEELKVRNRAVTVEDYDFLAGQIPFVHASRCLTVRRHEADFVDPSPPSGPVVIWKKDDPWTYGGIERAPGSVTVIIVTDQPVPRPEPTLEQITAATSFLVTRCDLTTDLKVVGPRYLPVSVIAEISIWPQARSSGVTDDDVKRDTLDAIQAFLHPTRGGVDGRGWAVGQPVLSSDLFAAIAPPREIGYVSDLALNAETPLYHRALNDDGTVNKWRDDRERPFALGKKVATVAVADYELVCAADASAHIVVPKTAQ